MRCNAFCLAALALACSTPAPAGTSNPQIDYRGFAQLVDELEPVRAAHLLPWEEFAHHSREKGALLLDPRTPHAFARGHLKGAVNVPLTDFSAETLREVIGEDTNRPIYIYCNNHFRENRPPVLLKSGRLAVAIPTFVNLHGYGYTNVWELSHPISTSDPGVEWVSGE